MSQTTQTTLTDTDRFTTPTGFNPSTYNAPAYDSITTHQDLIDYSRAYLHYTIDEYDMDIDTDHVCGFEVSTQAKRRAAGVYSSDLSKYGIKPSIGAGEIDWDAIREIAGSRTLSSSRLTDLKDASMSLTWGAFEEFSKEEWKETIRHEAIHIEQHHRFGKTGHGRYFKMRADDLETMVHCPKFTDYKYPFACSECGEDIGGKYRECKSVKSARKEDGKYTSKCCNAPITIADT